MLDLIKVEIEDELNLDSKVNRLREFLQILSLKAIYDNDGFNSIAFLGGTALRIVHHLRRFSEDLDFSVTDLHLYDFEKLLLGIQKQFAYLGLQVEIKGKSKTVNSCFLNFTNVLQELKLARHKDEKFSVKLEIDSNPPQGASFSNFDNLKYVGFRMKVYDLPSLMSGKIHAIMSRPYPKGRDFYDLLWYLNKKVKPNERLLINAFQQNQPELEINAQTWSNLLLNKLRETDFKKVHKDLERFLLDLKELTLIELSSFESLLLKQ